MPLDAGAVRVAVLAETNAYRASKNIPQLQKNAALGVRLLQQGRHRSAFKVKGGSVQAGMMLDRGGQSVRRTPKTTIPSP